MSYQINRTSRFSGRKHAFSLVEMMVAVVVLAILLGIIAAITSTVGKTVRWTSAKIDAFASSRSAFDLMGRKLSTATLNSYWDYDDPLNPSLYRRESNLHFLVRQNRQNSGYGQEIYFTAPESYSVDAGVQSLSDLLNACGFFVEYGNNDGFRPGTVTKERWRYRLMQGLQPTENLMIYNASPPATTVKADIQSYWTTYWNDREWITDISPDGTAVAPLADNVIALIVWPRLSAGEDPDGLRLTEDYQYDSKSDQFLVPQPVTANQLPPTVQVTLVTISEASAVRLDTKSNTPPAAIENALSGKFTDPAKHEDDLEAMADSLTAARVEFQIFNTSITLRESKWSDAAP